MKGKLLGGLAFLGAVAVLYVFAMPTYRQGEPSIAGRVAPDFAMEIDGKAMRLADLRGKVVVLNFWASWCPPCVEEMPSLIELHKRIENRGGLVLGVNLDDDEAAYERFVIEHKVVFPNHRDTSKSIPPAYGTAMYPETYILSRDGRIARKVVGPQEWTSPEMLSVLDTLLRAQ
jgi:thiol-disulfide isomerase/thioredoxin